MIHVAQPSDRPGPGGAATADIDEFAAHATSVVRRFPGTGLVVYPELHLFGDDPARLAEPLAGPTTKPRSPNWPATWGVAGPRHAVRTRRPDGVHNTAAVFSPDGRLAAAYRKCFPWRPYEPYLPGNEFAVFDLPGIGRAGLSICYDTWFPEVTRQLAWQGAEFVITPTKTTTSDRAQELVLSRANAIANQIYVLSVNAAAPGVGQSLVVDPEGRVRVDAGRAAEVLTDVIDLDDVTQGAQVRHRGPEQDVASVPGRRPGPGTAGLPGPHVVLREAIVTGTGHQAHQDTDPRAGRAVRPGLHGTDDRARHVRRTGRQLGQRRADGVPAGPGRDAVHRDQLRPDGARRTRWRARRTRTRGAPSTRASASWSAGPCCWTTSSCRW